VREFSVGEKILATWVDGKKYSAKVSAILANGKRPNLNYAEQRQTVSLVDHRLTFAPCKGRVKRYICNLFYIWKMGID